MYKRIVFLISLMMISSVFAQNEKKKKTTFIDVDRVMTKIFGKKEKKTKDIGQVNNTLETTIAPKFYKKRTEAIFNIGLIYYGDFYNDEQLARVQELLEKRFELATDSMIKLNVIFRAILPFKNQIKDFPNYSVPNVTDMERLQRLWYYDNKNMSVVNEIYQEAKSHNMYGKDFSKLDAMAVITGAQFNGLAFASGRVAVTENPMEIAWGLPDGGKVEIQSDEKVVDSLIHELGHTMHLGHAADQCFGNGISHEETKACCAVSENRNDVLSYCRAREAVDEEFFYKFEVCTLKTIKEKVIPAMLSGGEWELKNKAKCI